MATPTNSIRLPVVRDVVQHMALEEKEQLRNELALELDQTKTPTSFVERPQSGTTDSAGNDSVLDELEQFINDYAATDPAASDGVTILAEMRRVTGFARLRVVAADVATVLTLAVVPNGMLIIEATKRNHTTIGLNACFITISS